jgi:hypothetical protein
MKTTQTARIPAKRWTADELRKLPARKRDAIISASASRAQAQYNGDKSLTGFEAFGKEDLHGESANALLPAAALN